MGSHIHAQEAVRTSENLQPPGLVYRISNVEEWKQAQEDGGLFGGPMDRDSRFVHLSTEQQVPTTLKRFFSGRKDVVLLKIDVAKLGTGLKYEDTTGHGVFPHFYGQAGEYAPLPLEAVLEAKPIDENFTF